jgi:hypothetical protein
LNKFKKNIKVNSFCGENCSKILTSQNINSGASKNNKWIIIYRYEEMYKVLIHELIHYNNYDLRNIYSFTDCLEIYFGDNNYPVLLHEAITELQAQILNVIWFVYKNKLTNE